MCPCIFDEDKITLSILPFNSQRLICASFKKFLLQSKWIDRCAVSSSMSPSTKNLNKFHETHEKTLSGKLLVTKNIKSFTISQSEPSFHAVVETSCCRYFVTFPLIRYIHSSFDIEMYN